MMPHHQRCAASSSGNTSQLPNFDLDEDEEMDEEDNEERGESGESDAEDD